MDSLFILLPDPSQYSNTPIGSRNDRVLSRFESGVRNYLPDDNGLNFVWPEYESTFDSSGNVNLSQAQCIAAEANKFAETLLELAPSFGRVIVAGHSIGASILVRGLLLLKRRTENETENTDLRAVLRKIMCAIQFASPSRDKGTGYVGASRREIGQGVIAETLSESDIEQYYRGCISSWEEYAYPGDIVPATELSDNYCAVLWREALNLVNADKDTYQTCMKALELLTNGALEWLYTGDLDQRMLINTHNSLLWPAMLGPMEDNYLGSAVFEGVPAVDRASIRVAQRLTTRRLVQL